MTQKTDSPIEAIWQTPQRTADEKLLLYHLATKHELGDPKSSSWKPLPDFIEDFTQKWCQQKELQTKTNLSLYKVNRALESLTESGYVTTKEQAETYRSGKESGDTERLVSITSKIFDDYERSQTH